MSDERFKVDYEVGVLDTKNNEIICDTVNAEKVVDLLNKIYDENEELNEQLNNYHATFQSLLKTNIKLNNQLAETQEQLRGLYKILFPEPDEAEHINCRCSYEPIE